MSRYIRRKLLALPLVMLGVSLLVFLSVRVLPGDPARLLAGPEATQAAVDAMGARLGLDQPLLTQYATFLRRAAVGDFGVSLKSKLPVTQEIAERFPTPSRWPPAPTRWPSPSASPPACWLRPGAGAGRTRA